MNCLCTCGYVTLAILLGACLAGCGGDAALENQFFSEGVDSDTSVSTTKAELTSWLYIYRPISPRTYVDVQYGGTEYGTPVWTWTFNDSSAQHWSYNQTTKALVNQNGMCLDVQYGATGNGTPVWMWGCNGTGAQQWVSYYNNAIRNPQSNKCLDVPNGDPNPGVPLQLWDCNGTAAQRWIVAITP